jgi:hypothetical protein
MENEKKDLNELSEKVLRGMKKAIKKLVEKSAANNEKLVIADEAGKIQTVPAKDLLKSVQ